ncbi:FAR1 DNA binding domain-containing protein [Artemisia annua]|uniref:FAR1 DNA binding domain-containing protein n=1 Tax=Artemisia annua TaxID=35608 RepID=A0A2U1P2G2_ARTAN|nr:FAR1 DNA binding domain-containing protein [Artemisia annua]
MENIVQEHSEEMQDIEDQNNRLLVLSEQAFNYEEMEHDQDVNIGFDHLRACFCVDSNDVDIYELDPECIPTPHGELDNEHGKQKRKRRSTTSVTDCKAHLSLKRIVGTDSYKILKFVENHNHKLIDPANMDLSRARQQLEFGDHVFIHRASLSSIGPQKAHKLRVALLGGNTTEEKTPVVMTNLSIECHAREVYTHSVFKEVQHEISKSLHACSQISAHAEGDVEYCSIRHRDKRYNMLVHVTVSVNHSDGTFECSCGHFNRHGYLCRHVFCVFRIHGIDSIPQKYISSRFRKNVLPAHLRDKCHRYGPCIEETEVIASEIMSTVEASINLIRNDTEKLSDLLEKVKGLKIDIESDVPVPSGPQNKDALYEDLLGVTAPSKVIIRNPRKCRPKGSTRIKSAVEKGKAQKRARTNRKVPFRQRQCSNCGELGHNKATCTNPKVTKLAVESDAEDQEDEEDEQYIDEDQEDESDEHEDIDQDTEHDEDDQSESSSADE